MVFCLIFVPFGHYDEPETLRYEITSICPKGADVRQPQQLALAWDQLLIAEPEGPSFISRTGAQRRLDRRYS